MAQPDLYPEFENAPSRHNRLNPLLDGRRESGDNGGQRGPAAAWARVSSRMLALPMLFFFLIPIALLFVRITPARLLETIGQPAVIQAVGVSLKTTLVSLLVTILFGTPVAYLLRRKRFFLRSFVDALIDLPTVLPPSVAGLALLLALGRRGLIGGVLDDWGLQISFSQTAVVLAQTFVSAPFFIRAAAIGFGGIEPELVQAAQLDGASRWGVFRFVVLPLAEVALISGAVMSWSRALGEFGATIIFAGNFPGRTQTMPMAIYLGFESNLDVAMTLSVILIGFSFLSLLGLKVILSRKKD